ncbi:hypothetical protein [Turneriella parva]|uniref:Lipoprotein n=1 Tax=Turneriella parva (strain ATCC BAA-1111 / DSM 21527 / NCTC 11395 / H) TaxID=869212 RepID=I4B2E2_TURPD|nr:hypothetical protein [Turneriella parva]AFM11449.1 hypothetical protein Turpa_0798 [Turneriella parva DSM 21527]
MMSLKGYPLLVFFCILAACSGDISSQQPNIIGTYYHQGQCLADRPEKTALKIASDGKFTAAFWTCNTMRQVSGTYSILNSTIEFRFAPPSSRTLRFKIEGNRIIPFDRERTFYGCGIAAECDAALDYYSRIR